MIRKIFREQCQSFHNNICGNHEILFKTIIFLRIKLNLNNINLVPISRKFFNVSRSLKYILVPHILHTQLKSYFFFVCTTSCVVSNYRTLHSDSHHSLQATNQLVFSQYVQVLMYTYMTNLIVLNERFDARYNSATHIHESICVQFSIRQFCMSMHNIREIRIFTITKR